MLVPAHEVGQRQLQHAGDLGLLGDPAPAGLDQAHEGEHPVARHERADRRERAHHVDRGRVEADLLVRLAQGGEAQILVGLVLAPAGKGDLSRVAAKVVAALGEDGGQAVVALEERDEHRGVGLARRVHPGRLLGGEQPRAQVRRAGVRQVSSSAASSNMTSPSRVRCTGHLATICMSFSRCSAGSSLGKPTRMENLVGEPLWAGS